MKGIGDFKIRLSGGGFSYDGTVDEGTGRRIIALLIATDGASPISEKTPRGDIKEKHLQDAPKSVMEFIADKNPKTDTERIACLGYFLTKYKNVRHFKTRELTQLNTEAAQPAFSNAAFAVVNSTHAQYLAVAGGGRKQMSPRGLALVEALPDRQAAKAALEKHPLRGKKAKNRKVKRNGKKSD